MNAWDRQPDETPKAYAALWAYLGMGAARSLVKLRQNRDATGVGASPSTLDQWSARYQWVERARAYDDHMAAIEQQAREQALAAEAAKWAERQAEAREHDWTVAEQLRARSLLLLARPLSGDNLKARDLASIAAALERASKLARLAAELATESHQLNLTAEQWAALTDAELDELAAGRGLLAIGQRRHR